MEELPEYMEEEEEDYCPAMIRLELIEYILRRYNLLRAPDIARILNWKLREVNRVLKQLERSGRVKRMKLGRDYVWSFIEEPTLTPMYY